MSSPRSDGPRPRLLILSQTLPYPPDGGVKIRAWHTWRELATSFDLTALCFYRRSTTLPDSARAGLAGLAKVWAYPIPQEGSRTRLLWDHLRSVARGRVYTRYAYDADAYRAQLISLLATGGWSAVHAESLDLASYFTLVRDIPLICVHHDVQSHLLLRRSSVESSLTRRAYLRYQARLMKREERHWAGQVALNVVVSDLDRERLLALVPGARVVVVPNGVDTSWWTPEPEDAALTSDLVFVGGSDWFPNLDGLRWFSDSVLPLLRRTHPKVRVRWVGRASTRERSRFAALGIESTGYLDDPRDSVRQARCVMVPLRIGGGTRLKLLEAWALGKPVVSTSMGAEGLAAVDGDNILLRETPAEFAAAIATLLSEPTLRRRLGDAGRRTVEAHYQWSSSGARLRATYETIAFRCSGSAATGA